MFESSLAILDISMFFSFNKVSIFSPLLLQKVTSNLVKSFKSAFIALFIPNPPENVQIAKNNIKHINDKDTKVVFILLLICFITNMFKSIK